ncbi:MAG: radical SAM protein, partial [Muribaculaceae bacterium]|nr:radical SAM protein [Muribaculaceae bacterium]
MGIYEYLKLAVSGRIPDRLKLLGLWAFLVSGRRLAGVFFDPVMACNLRCKMCYMSDPEGRKPMKGQRIDETGFERIRKAFFKRALKLQIGCATEPTLFNGLPEIIAKAKADGVPYIALTTNGKQIARGNVDLAELAASGLNELTLSMHGTSKEIYEELMPGAAYDELLALTRKIAEAKRRHPGLKLRVNYTINSRNIGDLEADRFWQLWQPDGMPDIVQLRPVQKMGETEWNDFDLTPLKERYDATIGAIKKKCTELGIACIAPE